MTDQTKKTKPFRLPKKFLNEWIAALESRDYKQGKNFLYDDDSNTYCCLGVACSIKGIKDSIISEREMVHQVKDYAEEIPEELIVQSNIELSLTFSNVLAMLNDGAPYEHFNRMLIDFPGIIFPKEPPVNGDERQVYSFKDIVEFLKLNVEPYDEDDKI